MIRINCVYNDQGAWCKNKNVKRSLFGVGARCCKLYPDRFNSMCEFQMKYSRPSIIPPCPKRKENHEKILVVQI